MHLEVESKVRIGNVSEMRKKIKQVAKHKNTKVKRDEYFAVGAGYPGKAFRVRYDGQYVVNFKKRLGSLCDNNIVVKEEYEFSLKDKKGFENFMSLLGDLKFREWVKKEKRSETYLYNKDKRAGIEINKVKKLGWFLEIEYLCKRGEVLKAKKVIRQIFKDLDIQGKDIDNTGYTKMLWKGK